MTFAEGWRWAARFRGTGLPFLCGSKDWWVSYFCFCFWRGWGVGGVLSLGTTMVLTGREAEWAPGSAPWIVVRFVFVVGIVIAIAAAGKAWEALAFEVGNHVPEGGGLIVVAY